MKRLAMELAFSVNENRQEFVEYVDYGSEHSIKTPEYWQETLDHNYQVLRSEANVNKAAFDKAVGMALRGLARVLACQSIG